MIITTQEKKLPPRDWKEIRLKSVSNNSSVIASNSFSIALENEDGIIFAAITGEEADCSYTPIAGNGCHIKLIEYRSNIPEFSKGDLIRAFINAIQFEILPSGAYKYDYLWFDLNTNPISPLLNYFVNCSQNVYEDDIVTVYVFPLRING